MTATSTTAMVAKIADTHNNQIMAPLAHNNQIMAHNNNAPLFPFSPFMAMPLHSNFPMFPVKSTPEDDVTSTTMMWQDCAMTVQKK